MEQEKNGSGDVQLNEGFVCDLCGESFDSVSNLEEHKRDTHQRPSLLTETENWNVQGDIGAAGLPGAPQV